MKVAFLTLGCKVNSYDTEAMLNIFINNGYTEVNFDEVADVYIINTCTVTNLSDRKSRQMIRKATKINSNAIIVATGCYAQVAPEEVLEIEGIDIVIGTNDRKRIVDIINNFKISNLKKVSYVENILNVDEFENLEVDTMKNKTRVYLKIEEGCNNYCSYCIIPYARGKIKSRKENDVLDEVRKMVRNDINEVVLTGIHVASYGVDIGTNLLNLIEKINDVEGIERIRFSSVEPNFMTFSNLQRLKNYGKVCDFFHLSLQSGCDKTLKNMNRKYTSEEYMASVENIRYFYPNANITTDVIVGFPNENDEDFINSLNFCKKIGFGKIHVFPYSPKRGTKSFDMGDTVSAESKKERSKQLRELSDQMELEFIKSNSGSTAKILFEKNNSGYTTNYLRVYDENKIYKENQIVETKIIYNTRLIVFNSQ
ncbi:MAG: tRNA (N(6)-L-threonylcarbamoyladenosine(37)-C(2))-methylthiotransferase MtaB [Lachnospirales bacterium]